jgi:ribosomal protein S18 acetylase RimI-like enzyme
MRIAYYEAAYLEACKELLMDFYNNELCKCQFTEEKALRYLEELINAPRFAGFLLLDHEDQLMGAALCHERTWWYKDELHMDEFLISSQNRQSGYGSKLLRFMTRYARERDLAGITLITNNLAMADFYQKNDFHDHEIYFMYKGLEDKQA